MSYTRQGNAQRWKTLKKAISMHRSMDGMPILISGVCSLSEGLMAPAEVRKDIRSYIKSLVKV